MGEITQVKYRTIKNRKASLSLGNGQVNMAPLQNKLRPVKICLKRILKDFPPKQTRYNITFLTLKNKIKSGQRNSSKFYCSVSCLCKCDNFILNYLNQLTFKEDIQYYCICSPLKFYINLTKDEEDQYIAKYKTLLRKSENKLKKLEGIQHFWIRHLRSIILRC